jgi:hypothetical protein
MTTHTMLLANCNPLLDCAVLANDVTAPVEATMAPVGSSLLDDVVTATAAEGATTVDTGASAITLSPGCTREVHVRISFAEVRGTLVVKKVQG